MPLAGSVTITSAPKAFSNTLRSILMDDGIVRISLYPFDAAIKARPIPVFPLVGSTSTL
jgi:hypothetical protein